MEFIRNTTGCPGVDGKEAVGRDKQKDAAGERAGTDPQWSEPGLVLPAVPPPRPPPSCGRNDRLARALNRKHPSAPWNCDLL